MHRGLFIFLALVSLAGLLLTSCGMSGTQEHLIWPCEELKELDYKVEGDGSNTFLVFCNDEGESRIKLTGRTDTPATWSYDVKWNKPEFAVVTGLGESATAVIHLHEMESPALRTPTPTLLPKN